MKRVLVTDGMDPSAIEKLSALGYEVIERRYAPGALGEALQGFDVLVVRSQTQVGAAVIDAAARGRLKLIVRGGVGLDNIDAAHARARGIEVANTPGASSTSVAELAIGHMFCLARHLHASNVTRQMGKEAVHRHGASGQDAGSHWPGPHRKTHRRQGRRAGHERDLHKPKRPCA